MMNLLFISNSLLSHIVDALCWTLVHSIWQGVVLAIVAGLILISTKKSSPALRYNLLSVASILFIIGTAISFVLVFSAKNSDPVFNNNAVLSTYINEASVANAEVPGTSFLLNVKQFFDQYAAAIVLCWMLIIAFRCFRLIGGLYRIRQIKLSGNLPADQYWIDRTRQLCEQLSISRPVRFLESTLIKIPMVLGHFKPVILFPAGVFTCLSPAEIEAILIHELAHIRRNDYLANIVQCFLEIVFFFNPATNWVSNLIKTERENCCDDIAVARASSKRNYINALLSFQEYNLNIPTHAVAFGRGSDQLLQRVKRIIYNNNKTLNAMEKLFLGSGLLVTGLLVFAFSSNEPQQQPRRTEALRVAAGNVVSQPLTDTIPPSPSKVITSIEGKEYVLELKDDKIISVSVDGKPVPASKLGDIKTITDKILLEVKAQGAKAKQLANMAALQEAEMKIQVEKLELMQTKLAADRENITAVDAERKAKELQSIQMDLKEKLAMLQSGKAKLSEEELVREVAMVEHEKAMVLLNQSKMAQTEQLKQLKEMKGLSTLQSKEFEKLNRQIAEEHQKLARLHAEREMMELKLLASANEVQAANELSKVIVEDLIANGLIKNETVSVQLNSRELVINGVKQPADVHKKFKEKYVKDGNWNFNFKN